MKICDSMHYIGFDYRHPVTSYTETVIPLPISNTHYRHHVLDIRYRMTDKAGSDDVNKFPIPGDGIG